ncbi:hypothetical protein [Streptomyces avicenniae]|uniref:hypothetical protein n=1 Tax=Streptomyces avicenniae TaxID=500153 RepID=UPI00069A20EA|nr:hypothetical protein [Streptomyces avicenniae]
MNFSSLGYESEGYRDAGRGSLDSSDAAESSGRYLRMAEVNPGSYAGATEFPAAVIATREKHIRGVGMAAEGRENMAGADFTVADEGDELEIDTNATINGVVINTVSADSSVADAI